MKGKKILVTGASGLVGSALAFELSKDNRVYGLARFRDATVKQRLQEAGVKIIQKDVRKDSLDDLPRDFDYVFSQLALLRDESEENPADAFTVNTYFVGRLMEACQNAAGVVLGSTGAVYLPGPNPLDENGLIAPRNTYATSKFGGEVLGSFLCQQWRIPTCILRYWYPFGPTGGLVTGWVRQVAKGEEIEVGRGGIPRYTPHYMSDCVKYTIGAAQLCSIPARVINVGGEEELSQREIIDIIGETLGKAPTLRETDNVPLFWVADVSLMKQLLGPQEVSLREGIARVARAVQRQG